MKQIRKMLCVVFALCLMFSNISYAAETGKVSEGNPSISYQTHVQSLGWQDYVSDGKTNGTVGKSLRLEGIRIKLENSPAAGNIEYSTHVQNIGWQDYVSNAQMSGTSGKSLRLEAIRIRLTGEMANRYDVYYRVHSQNYGWLGWAKNGENAGTEGYAYRLEAIEMKLVEKGAGAPGSTANSYYRKTMAVNYRTHVQNIGWQAWKTNGAMAGTSGKSLRLEGIQINLSNPETSGNIEYRTHVQNIGWQDWKKNGVMSGTSGKSLRLEAIQIRLTGNLANLYDVYYRVHAQNFGWLDWAKNGESSGTEGYSFRLEGIEIRLVKKGQAAPGKTQLPFTALNWSAGVTEAEKEIAKSVNVLRYSKGQPLLKWNAKLHQATRIRAKELKSLFSHTRPNGSSCFTVLPEVNYNYSICGENIMWTTYTFENEAQLGNHFYQGWYNSPGHYQNMVHPDFSEIGVGIYKYDGVTYGVQLFGSEW